MKESVEVIRAREAIEALKLAREVLMVGASSLVRAGDDDGLFYSNELHAVCQELNEHMRQIKANTVDDFS